jgi:type II secretion system protein J
MKTSFQSSSAELESPRSCRSDEAAEFPCQHLKPLVNGNRILKPAASLPRQLRGPAVGVFSAWSTRAFTLVEIMIAITILSLVLAAIYSTWTAILRSSKVGLDAAASVQRARVAVRTIEESLASAELFVKNAPYYAFLANNGSDASLSFVARLDKFFPRSGKFGDLDVRRVTFAVEAAPDSSKELVLRQQPLLMDLDKDEQNHPLVLAKNVKDFQMQFWDNRLNDWADEWTQTNALPRVLMITLKVADRADSTRADEVITRIISIPSMPVPPGWQLPMNMGGALPPGASNNIPPPGLNPNPGGNPNPNPGSPRTFQ